MLFRVAHVCNWAHAHLRKPSHILDSDLQHTTISSVSNHVSLKPVPSLIYSPILNTLHLDYLSATALSAYAGAANLCHYSFSTNQTASVAGHGCKHPSTTLTASAYIFIWYMQSLYYIFYSHATATHTLICGKAFRRI